ncbi:MAG: thiolase domain-containing protein [Chloroflexi bacterium]|nr:thiolase domain-containing protein [Chloroflexota bacterium]
MTDVSIIGIGQTRVAEHWDLTMRDLAAQAAHAALDNAGIEQIDALYVSNMLAGELSRQEHVSALAADAAGMSGIEAIRIEAADASGGAALRQAYLAVASGVVEFAMVLGVESMTDLMGNRRTAALSTSLDADFEAMQGATPAAMAALMMRRYMHETGTTLDDFAGFSVNAHSNGGRNPNAMYRNRLKPERFASAPPVATPVNLFDAAPEGDGAAALILTRTERARDLVPNPIRIAGSAVASDRFALHDRSDPLTLSAVVGSASKAYMQAGINPQDIDVFELHDSFTIMAALALEASGFAERGQGYTLAREEEIGLGGRIPVQTFGGLKARGHAGGATGVYQVVEIIQQLRAEAGENQVANARVGMAQNIGGIGSTAVTHIFERVD